MQKIPLFVSFIIFVFFAWHQKMSEKMYTVKKTSIELNHHKELKSEINNSIFKISRNSFSVKRTRYNNTSNRNFCQRKKS